MASMDLTHELVLYAEQLLFLSGTLLYGYLARELLRRPEVLAGNWPARALLVSLTLWFGGTLLDQMLFMLVGTPPSLARPGNALDLVRGFAWLLSLPLLAHTLAKILADTSREARPVDRLLAAIPYLPLAGFVAPAFEFAASGTPWLGAAIAELHPRLIAHSALSLSLAGLTTLRLSRQRRFAAGDERRLLSFLRALTGVLITLLLLMVASGFFRPWAEDAAGGERLLRTLLLGGLLLPGGLFAFYVQRYNLLRLSLSYSTLRHYLGVLLLVLLVILAGPTLGVDDIRLLRRFVAWGLLLAFLLGTVYRPLSEAVITRSTALRRFLGRTLSPRELDRLMDQIQNIDLDESTALEQASTELGRWLGSAASFLPPPEASPGIQPFWAHFARSEAQVVHRLDPPTPQLAALLSKHRLQAVFPLRVEGELEGLLALSSSATGGTSNEELEAVRLVMRQLAGTLALRRLVTSRVAEERRLVEHERLGMLGLVSASLAHEIKNPLSSMKALAQALREDLAAEGAPEDHQRRAADGVADLDVIVEQIDRLHDTTREILGLARPRSGEPVDLAELVHSAHYVLHAEARKRGVDVQAAEIQPVGTVPGSAAAWQTVVFNLMLNAIEHTPAGQTIDVSLTCDDGA
ncbi:MAG: histidine kinase dimerization/phospho-acceptor domain-containing protein, partial [Acidobacteriota bacterium]